MTARIKFHSFRFLFRLFDFLAEKSGGWALFVRPKLIFGSLIIGLGFTNSYSKTPTHKLQEPRKATIKKVASKDSVSLNISSKKNEDSINSTRIVTLCYEVVGIVDQFPEFSGGEKALFKFINDNIKYPKEALDKNQQGRVICRFSVTKDGSIENVSVLKGISPSIDKEAIRVIKSMPKWIPGKQAGVNVSVWCTLPILFALTKE